MGITQLRLQVAKFRISTSAQRASVQDDNLRLANNLAVVFGHLQEVSDLHAALGDTCGVLPARLGPMPK